jgi:ATP-binding cassette subfamily B protein
MTEPRLGGLTVYRRLLWQARPHWIRIAALFGLSLLEAPLNLLVPLPLKIVVDSVIGNHPLPRFATALLPADSRSSGAFLLGLSIALVVAIALFACLQALGVWLLATSTGEQLVLEFRALLFRHVQRLSLAYHDRRGVADSAYRIQFDACSIQSIALQGLTPLITAFATLAGMIYVTMRIDWQLAMVALGVAPVLLLLILGFGNRLRERWEDVKRLDSAAFSVVQEVLGAVRVVKAFGREDHEEDRFIQRSTRQVRGQVRVAFLQGSFDLLVGVTIALGTAATLWVGVLHVKAGILSLGELLMVIAYLAQLYEPLKTLAKKSTGLQSSLASAGRALSLLDEVPDVSDSPEGQGLVRARGAIMFQNVSFAYNEGHSVLRDISFSVEPGSRVGVYGTTGAGKTSLVNLLNRFYDPGAGRILLDGLDLKDYRLADLRAQFAIVLQDSILFSTTVAENIAYGRPGAHREEILAAARAANAHDFISTLPEGYDTQVGERGMSLSGGQRQRVALARAFLKDAPILILDEPTSALDVRTEAKIVEAMERLMRNRTTFIIAHRQSALAHCDQMLHLEHGRLVEDSMPAPAAVG